MGALSPEAKTLRQASAGDLSVEPQRWGHDFNLPFYVKPGEGQTSNQAWRTLRKTAFEANL